MMMTHEELKARTLHKLNLIVELIENEQYEDVEDHLGFSLSGSAEGEDNYFINFEEYGASKDIDDVLRELIGMRDKK